MPPLRKSWRQGRAVGFLWQVGGMTRQRLVHLSGTHNFRDTGGYRVGASVARRGRLFGSDVMHGIDDARRGKLVELGVSRVVDLRSDHEIDAAPNLVDGLGITVHRVPVFDGAAPTAQIPQDITVGALHRHIVDERRPRLVEAIRLIPYVPDDGSVVVHCTAGKDRTGLVVALVLAAARVARGDVVSDYAQTEGHLRGAWADAMLAAIAAKGFELTPGLIEMVTASPASVMDEVLADLEAAHGTVAGYLRANGLSEAELSALTTSIVAGPDPG